MSEDADNQPGRLGGIFNSVKRLIRTAAATLHNRVELFAIELQEEGIRFVGALLLVGLTLLLSGLTLIMGMFTVLLAVSEEHRLLAGIIMTLLLLASALGCGLWLNARLRHWSAFPATRAELRKDREWLQSNTTET